MLSRFFINRPIFATVLALIMLLSGIATMFTLPIAQFPQVVPPTVQVMIDCPVLVEFDDM